MVIRIYRWGNIIKIAAIMDQIPLINLKKNIIKYFL